MKRSPGERRQFPPLRGQRLPDVVLLGPGRVAVPDRPGHGGRPVPHRPVPAGAPPRQDPRRPGSAGPQARLGLDRAAPPCGVQRSAAGHVRIGYARASTVRQSLDTQTDWLKASGITRIFAEKISTRALTRPELDRAVALAREIRASGAAVTIAVHGHKRLGRGIELAALSGMEREYIRDCTLEGHESARARGKAIGGAAVTDEAMLAAALHLRGQELSLRGIAGRLVIATGRRKASILAATVMRMLREHDKKTAAAVI